ncbi:MAG: S8 family serine peptidase, partial [Pseudomonadota bacterium]
ACISSVISVGATWDTSEGSGDAFFCTDTNNQPDLVTCFSNSSATTDLMAPGAPTTSTDLAGGVATYFGTSQATPLVAACAALLKQSDPTVNVDTLETRLKATQVTVNVGASGRSFPRLDCLEAISTNVNNPPSVTISTPINGQQLTSDVPFNLSGVASDTEDGDLSSEISWRVNNSLVGTGSSVAHSFSLGNHVVSAQVTDSELATATTTINIAALAANNTVPLIAISLPDDNASFHNSEIVQLQANAQDAEDGDLTASIEWFDNSVSFATGGSATRQFSAGNHVISVRVTDSGNATSSASVSIAISDINDSGDGSGGSSAIGRVALLWMLTVILTVQLLRQPQQYCSRVKLSRLERG